MLLYIHGFNSSPKSQKATILTQYCRTHYPHIKVVTPKLPVFPLEAVNYLSALIGQYQHEYHIGLVGSSLGGYMSIWLNSLFQLKTVLVNPAVRPYELLVDYLGEQVNPYTHEHYFLAPHHIDELRSLDVSDIQSPDQFLLLQQTGDEVLDYRQAVAKMSHSKQIVEEGGDHSFVGFERHCGTILQFLAL
ncbi:esterase YqiA [Vibrio aerogenes CECT 7868]|uniref:Esterase YqiA n=2 Tax=Vibrio aerogenes TaxID=92172 RepID=A0A1M5YGT3_9VIBR|nr:esterase YqiA [Vibrio aerogenes CECT 7868]